MQYDRHTEAYFDQLTPEYSPNRLAFAIEFISRQSSQNLSLIDLGCGTGNILEHLQKSTKIQQFCGVDLSEKYLELVRQKLDCRTVKGSVLDPALPDLVAETFDVALLAAVLHHLVGRTRRQSRQLAAAALQNALRVLKPGGYLIVLEPVFYPNLMMDVVFYLKKLVTSVTSRRIGLFGYWNNIGAPVVSYFTNERLRQMIEQTGGCEIVEFELRERKLTRLMRAAFITRNTDTTVVIRKK
ncbi:MAG: methyltransferase domain-containing protein [bacterium]|nr:methyltransferase domain-containing protein [bacterium]